MRAFKPRVSRPSATPAHQKVAVPDADIVTTERRTSLSKKIQNLLLDEKGVDQFRSKTSLVTFFDLPLKNSPK